MNQILSFVLPALLLPCVAHGQFRAELQYSTYPDTDGFYKTLPRSTLVIETPSSSVATFLKKVQGLSEPSQIEWPKETYRIEADGNKLLFIKDSFYSSPVASYYKKKHGINLMNCVNHIERKRDVIDYARFVSQVSDLEKMPASRLTKLKENVNKASERLKSYLDENSGVCPTDIPKDALLESRHLRKVENVFFSLFVPIHDSPSPLWVEINKESNLKLLMDEKGLWHLDAKGEVDVMEKELFAAASIGSSYYSDIKDKQYDDFFSFMSDFRVWLKKSNKNKAIATEIGVACLPDVQSAFKPFKLSKCISEGNLEQYSTEDANSVILVEASRD